MNKVKIAYICDRKACKICHPECNHTTKFEHSKNFTTYPNDSDLLENFERLTDDKIIERF